MRDAAIKHILAPTDLGESGVVALQYARMFTDRMKAKLTVLYSDPIIYPVDVVGPMPSLFVASTPEHEARLRWDVEHHVDSVLRGVPYEVAVTVGQPAPTILRAATERDVDLIVMGTHARRGWRRALLGSVTEGVLHGSRCPVLTVSSHDRLLCNDAPVGVTRIVCPINFTDVARDSLRYAVALAEQLGAEMIAVHVVETPQEVDIRAHEERVRQWVDPELRDLCAYRELVLRGGAAERVLDSVDDLGADLLVIGAQHRMFRDTTVIGTTTERLVRFAPCPVLVVTRAAVGVEEELVRTYAEA